MSTNTVVDVSHEMSQSYLDYAMSVIVGRALPDVYDGLKPVHRRVLFAMHQINCVQGKPYKKSAAVVGDVLGKYHPHGDSAVYDTIVRLAQPFSMRYPLIDGQGNFGSVDGDTAAAMRYTEVRMEKIAEELLADIDKDTVEFVPNYDGSLEEPVVLPAKLPNLLVNGSSGIAVGMATNIPPHNLGEVVDALLLILKTPSASIEDIMKVLPAPDFPTGGILLNVDGLVEAYKTGKGKVTMRSRCHFENDKDRTLIVVTEIPYLINKARMIERIAELVRDKKVEGISEIRDESNKQGIRVVLVLQRGENADIIVNNLYRLTSLQTTFSFNMVALQERQPKLFSLKEMLEAFIGHRRRIITHRTIYLLAKAKATAHVLEGLAVAVANIDRVVELIKTSKNPQEARSRLMQTHWISNIVEKLLDGHDQSVTTPDDIAGGFGLIEEKGSRYYQLSERQAQTILELRLQRLTQLEHDKILVDYKKCLDDIARYLDILANPSSLNVLLKEELTQLREQFADPRRSEISHAKTSLEIEDLIKDENKLITISNRGYSKIQAPDTYRQQRRGGRGKVATTMRGEDYIEHLLVGSTLSTLLCFSNLGRVYWVRVHELPEASRNSRGKPLANVISLDEGEAVKAVLCVESFDDNAAILMVTKKGFIKKVSLTEFSRPRPSGKIAITLNEGDNLTKAVQIDSENSDIMIFTSENKALRFSSSAVRSMGRSARGVRGIQLSKDHAMVAGLEVINSGKQIIAATDTGVGKRINLEHFNARSRGGKGVAVFPKSKNIGTLTSICQVSDDDELMLITTLGILIRMSVDTISELSRNAKGVSLVKLEDGDTLVAMAPLYDAD